MGVVSKICQRCEKNFRSIFYRLFPNGKYRIYRIPNVEQAKIYRALNLKQTNPMMKKKQ